MSIPVWPAGVYLFKPHLPPCNSIEFSTQYTFVCSIDIMFTFFRTNSNITKDTMEWVLYLVSNLNGDASVLSIPAPSNYPLPLIEDPPDVNAGAPDQHGVAQVNEEVIFDGNIDDLHQVVVVEQEDVGEVNKQALEEHDAVQNMVRSLVSSHSQKGFLFTPA